MNWKVQPSPHGRPALAWLVLVSLLPGLSCRLGESSTSVEPSSTAVPKTAIPKTPPAVFTPPPVGNSIQAYYVSANDPEASDENNGLYAEYQGGKDGPWRTVQHAASQLQPGQTAFLRQGIYHEFAIQFAHSGEAEARVALQAYPGETPILDGAMFSREAPGIWITPGQSHILLQGLTIRNMPWSGIATQDDASQAYQDITILDCALHGNRWSGIGLFGVDGFRVEGVESYENGYYGINIGSSAQGTISSANGVVLNSSFHDQTGEEGHGLALNQAHDVLIQGNRAYHNRIHGFDASDMPKGGELSYNIVFEENLSYDNGGAGFSINSDSHHVTYRRNIAWRNGADWRGEGTNSGFLCYEGCWHVEYQHNVSAQNSDAGFSVTDAWGSYSQPEDSLLVFKNNIAWDNGLPEWDIRLALAVEGAVWQIVAEANDWGGPTLAEALVVAIHIVGEAGETYTVGQLNAGAFQSGNRSVEPGFLALANGDFHLLPGSLLIDAGVDLGQPFCGAAPDLGAFELCP